MPIGIFGCSVGIDEDSVRPETIVLDATITVTLLMYTSIAYRHACICCLCKHATTVSRSVTLTFHRRSQRRISRGTWRRCDVFPVIITDYRSNAGKVKPRSSSVDVLLFIFFGSLTIRPLGGALFMRRLMEFQFDQPLQRCRVLESCLSPL